ncbi:hypothetical protein O3M35_010946 [Rhynocoris fuscipes]|uniref:F-box domain-containing protein n=1 Tax=Rhynocoris fuscipes TaxID=488301 RepID=A0AAW1D2B6_9HEMI
MDNTDISKKNGIVLENILPYVDDATTVMRLSAVCKRWYELLNTDTVLWNRLLNLEQIEDPQDWNRADDNDEWTLGTPCTPKNILINYRKTYYYIKHNIYKKYEFQCDEGIFEYDGNTVLFTKHNELFIYKIINNNLELFQKIKLNFLRENITSVLINSEFIIICFHLGKIIAYKLNGNQYIGCNVSSFGEFNVYDCTYMKLLKTNVLIGGFGDYWRNSVTTIAWNIPDDRVIFNESNNQFIKYEKGIIYIIDRSENKLVLYNEKFEIICKIDISFERDCSPDDGYRFDIHDVSANNVAIAVVYKLENGYYGVSVYEKSSGQNLVANILGWYSDCGRFAILGGNNDLIFTCSYTDIETDVVVYKTPLTYLWSSGQDMDDSDLYVFKRFHYVFNKLFIAYEGIETKESKIEFRDVHNGNISFKPNLFKHFHGFHNDMLVFNLDGKKIVLLYR